MKIFKKEINNRYALWILLQALIIVDIVLITAVMLFPLPKNISSSILIFDFCICIVLLIQWAYNFYISKPKKVFLKQKANWIDLIASIPFDVILPVVVPQAGLLRYLRLLKILRVIALFNRFFNGFENFLKKSNMDVILGAMFFTVIVFTCALYIFGGTYGLFDDFYFVMVTLTTVGYGDVVPKTFNEKVITIVLIFLGIFVFSTITAAISSYLTDRLLSDNDITIEQTVEDMLDEKLHDINDGLKDIKNQLELSNKQNIELKEELDELKELLKNNDQ